MIDWTRVAELREEIGPEDFSEVVDIFLEEVDAAVEAINDNSTSLEDKLHFLKGSALNLGFNAFSDLCQDGETRAGQGEEFDTRVVVTCYHKSRIAFVKGLTQKFAA